VTAAPLALLEAAGKLDPRGLARARAVAAPGERLPPLLARLGVVGEGDLAAAYAAGLGLPLVEAGELPARPPLLDRISPHFLRRIRAVPVRIEGEALLLAMADPEDDEAAQAVALSAGRPVRRAACAASPLEALLDRLCGLAAAPDAAAPDAASAADAGEGPAIRLVSRLLDQAAAARASDIHLEPAADGTRVRLRIDGVLQPTETLAPDLHPALVSRVKILAGLDIAERRRPHDGRFTHRVAGRELDLRVSILPTAHGESVVLRLLDAGHANHDLAALGLAADIRGALQAALDRGRGIVLVAGPTGSGKTTTLYAALARLAATGAKIVTAEDPVEYLLPGTVQVAARPDLGLDFAAILRALLRHDPDVVLIGEIRDAETARIAVQAALTGHLVLATIHTTSAAGAVTRLLDMGVEDYLLTAALAAVLSQRLVRTLCPRCAGGGCPACRGGFAGRTVIGELLTLGEELRGLIRGRAEEAALHGAAIRAGMRPLIEDGRRAVAEGRTTLAEVLRVVG